MNAVLKYPGSKWSTSDWIISHFPSNYDRMTYLEPFFGSGAIFFNKIRSDVETINDMDSQVYNLFCIIRDRPHELATAITFTPWSREEYLRSYEIHEDPLESARRFLVRMWQAIGSKTSDKTGWRNNIQENAGGVPRFHTDLPEQIIEVSERFKHNGRNQVQIENKNAFDLIDRYNRENVLMYVDPPYVMSTRNKRIYKHEFTDEMHEQLLDQLMQSKAKIVLSGYDSELYNAKLIGWNRDELMANCESGQRKKEVIWYNYQKENTLF